MKKETNNLTIKGMDKIEIDKSNKTAQIDFCSNQFSSNSKQRHKEFEKDLAKYLGIYYYIF